jgi:AraC family transcriptional regulator
MVSQHAHERACFCLSISGGFDECFGPRTIHCRTSSVLFRPAHEPHRDVFDAGGAECFLIEPEASWLAHIGEHTNLLNEPVKQDYGVSTRLALDVFRECADPDDLSVLAIEGLALELVANFARGLRKV